MRDKPANISFGKRIILTALVALGVALFNQVANSPSTTTADTAPAQMPITASVVGR